MQKFNDHKEKIVTVDKIGHISSSNSKKVLVGGCFDIFHYGHASFLENARAEGDMLVILLESDEFIRKYKKREPLHSQEQRAEILAHLTVVDYIIKLPLMTTNTDYADLVSKLRPSVIAVTEGDEKLELKKLQAEKIGAEIKVVTSQLPFSSSQYASFFRD
ncbi:MAG: adenylyltransferase/cytidyltransferase family protein [Patescibacteria group bacterium]